MSKFLTKAVKKPGIISIIVATILAAAIAVAIICGVQGFGVFNTSKLLEDSKTLTVSVDKTTYLTKLDQVEETCEKAFKNLDLSYELKGEMTGAESELVYVFDKNTDLTNAKKALEDTFKTLTEGEWNGSHVIVATNSEEAVSVLAKHYVLRGVIAGVVMAVLAFAYVSLRYRLGMGIVAAVCTLLGMLLTAAFAILTRIPVTSSVSYVFAVAGLLSAVTTLFTLNKFRANADGEELACKEIGLFTVLFGAALVVIGAVATAGVRWFAVLALIALLVAACLGLVYAPALYLPIKAAADSKPAKDAYVGAKKTSTKVKKSFVKAEETAEEAPVEEAEEAVETVEEAEEASVEETVEEPTEETAETVEEAPVEEAEETEETVEETEKESVEE